MENYNLLDSVSTEKSYLTLAGFYPAQLTGYNKCLYVLSAFINLSISWLQFLSMATFSYVNLNDPVKVTEILLFCVTQFGFLNKLTNLLLHRSSLLKLETIVQSATFTNVSVYEKTVLNRHVNEGKFLAKLYRILCFLGVVFYTLYPFIDGRSERNYRLPLPCWFPFDEYRYYYQVFFVEIWSIAVSAFVNSSMDVLTAMLMILTTAEFEILSRRLRNISEERGEVVTDEEDGLVVDRLRACVYHYDEVLYFVEHIQTTFSRGIFIQFLCSVLVICLTGFQMLIISFNSIQFVLLVIYIACMMCQVVMYCWYGHTVMESSNKITDACYMSKWDNCSLKVKKSLLIVMERAKKPAILRAGNFFTLNIPTLMTILRSSYSYFAVLQRLYGDD